MNKIRFIGSALALVAMLALPLAITAADNIVTVGGEVRNVTGQRTVKERASDLGGGIVARHSVPQSRAAAAADIHAPAAATAAVVTYAAVPGYSHAISGIAYSYSAAPTGGNLKIEDGSGTTVFTQDITAAGPGVVYFDVPKRGTENTAFIVTLASGAGAVVGKVSVLGHWTED